MGPNSCCSISRCGEGDSYGEGEQCVWLYEACFYWRLTEWWKTGETMQQNGLNDALLAAPDDVGQHGENKHLWMDTLHMVFRGSCLNKSIFQKCLVLLRLYLLEADGFFAMTMLFQWHYLYNTISTKCVLLSHPYIVFKFSSISVIHKWTWKWLFSLLGA